MEGNGMKKLAILVLLVMMESLVSPFGAFASASKDYTIRVYNDGFDSGGKVTVVLYDNNWNRITSEDSYVSSDQDYTDVTFYLDEGDYNFEVYYTPNGGSTEYWGAKSFNVCSYLWCGSSTDFHRNWPYEDGWGWKYLDSNHDSISTSVTIKVPEDAPADSFSVYYKVEAKNTDTGKTITDQSASYDVSKGTTEAISDPYTKLNEAGTYKLTYYIYAKASWGSSYVLVDQVDAGTVIVPEVINAEIVSPQFSKEDLKYQDAGTATVHIKNTGNARTTFSITLKYYKDGTSTKYTIDTKSVTLDPGQTSSALSFTYTWDELYNHGGAGTYKMYFEVTKYGSSNVLATGPEASITVEAPKIDADIVYFDITDSILSPTSPHNTGIAAVRVRNTGDIEETFHVALVAASSADYSDFYKIDSTEIQLNPGETSYTLNLEYTYDELKAISGPGNYELYAIVYKDSIYPPLDTSNKKTVTIEEPRLQFEITNFALDKNTYYPNDNITAKVTVKNTGNIPGKISSIRVEITLTNSSDDILRTIGEEYPSTSINPGNEISLTFTKNIKKMDLPSGNYTVIVYVDYSDQGKFKSISAKVYTEIIGNPEFELTAPFKLIGYRKINIGTGGYIFLKNITETYFNKTSGYWYGYSVHQALYSGVGIGESFAMFAKTFTVKHTGEYNLQIDYGYKTGYVLGIFSTGVAAAAGHINAGFMVEIIDKNSGKAIFATKRYLFSYKNPEDLPQNTSLYEIEETWKEVIKESTIHETTELFGNLVGLSESECAIFGGEVGTALTLVNLIKAFDSTVQGNDADYNATYTPNLAVHLESGKEYLLIIIPFERDELYETSTVLFGGTSSLTLAQLAIRFYGIRFIPSSLEDAVPPQTNITSYPAEGVPSHTKFKIAWNAKDDLTPSSEIEYSWKLKGYDSTWSLWNHDTSVEYSLPPGHYLFQIRAKDTSGNIAYKSIPVTVYPQYNATITAITDESGKDIMPRAGENIYVTVHNSGPDAGSVRVIIAVTRGLTMHPPYEQTVYLEPGESKTLTFYVSPNDDSTSKESVLFATYNNETNKPMDVKTYDLVVQPNKPPTLSFISPSPSQHVNQGDTLQIKVNATDTDGIRYVGLYLDGNLIKNWTSGPYTYFLNTNSLPVGQHTLKAVAVDRSGQKNETSVTFYVDQPNVDNPPTIQVTNKAQLTSKTWVMGEIIRIEISAGDDKGITKIEYWVNGQKVDSHKFNGGTTISDIKVIPQSSLVIGKNNITVIAYDTSGQTGEDQVTIQVKANEPPTITLYYPGNNTTLKRGQNITLSAQIKDDVGLSRVELRLDGINGALLDSISGISNPYHYTHSFNTSAWSVGVHEVYIIAYDTANKESSKFIIVNVTSKESTPTIQILNKNVLTSKNFTQGDTIVLRVSAQDSTGLDYIEYLINGNTVKMYHLYNTTSITITSSFPSNIFKIGKNTITVVAYNIQGMHSSDTVTINIRKLSLGDYGSRVGNASRVYLVFNKFGTPDAFSVAVYVSRTIPARIRVVSRITKDFTSTKLTSNDILITVGGPLVNSITAKYNNQSKINMSVINNKVIITTPEQNITWSIPEIWWNVSEGYFIIQVFQDSSGALVVTIYGTDADSTMAGAYYFMTQIYPNINEYTNTTYIIGEWQDTEPGADYILPGASKGDTSGFSTGDSITIIAEG